MALRRFWTAAALLLLPLAVAARSLGWGDGAVFGLSIGAIIPLAILLSTATEELALALGPTPGALLNALFGNATELIIALVALRAGLVDIVKASITGTVMANLLLALGLSMAIGGIGRDEQRFPAMVARVNGTPMTLALLAILLPSLAPAGAGEAALGFSGFVAWLLLAVYGMTLLFSLGTHRQRLATPAAVEALVVVEEGGHEPPPVLPWLLVLVLATAGLALASELFVDVVAEVTEGLGFSATFTGVVLLPLLGGTAEYVTAVSMARRDRMQLSVSVALGSTLLVALLVVPVLVLLGPWLGHPLDLRFSGYELVAIGAAVVVSNLVSLDGRSDWLEGVLLLATYVILAAGFWFPLAG
jgi:Ca2+:H+ antiporter